MFIYFKFKIDLIVWKYEIAGALKTVFNRLK